MVYLVVVNEITNFCLIVSIDRFKMCLIFIHGFILIFDRGMMVSLVVGKGSKLFCLAVTIDGSRMCLIFALGTMVNLVVGNGITNARIEIIDGPKICLIFSRRIIINLVVGITKCRLLVLI